MALKTGYEDQRARVEMIPLMDVVFLLLVFFVYAMFNMSVQRGVKVDLPQADGVRQNRTQTIITLCADKRIMLNDQESSLDEAIMGAVQQWRDEQQAVLINADKTAPLGAGIELLDKLRRAGVSVVAFQVRPEDGKP
jgi:biopolymer transport protein ExbD